MAEVNDQLLGQDPQNEDFPDARAKLRLERAFKPVFREECGVFQNGVTGGAERGAAEVVVADHPRRHYDHEGGNGDGREDHPPRSPKENQVQEDREDQPAERIVGQPTKTGQHAGQNSQKNQPALAPRELTRPLLQQHQTPDQPHKNQQQQHGGQA